MLIDFIVDEMLVDLLMGYGHDFGQILNSCLRHSIYNDQILNVIKELSDKFNHDFILKLLSN